jgi:hypothetical protein
MKTSAAGLIQLTPDHSSAMPSPFSHTFASGFLVPCQPDGMWLAQREKTWDLQAAPTRFASIWSDAE